MLAMRRRNAVTSTEWGRVDDDGTVYVKTADGERAVGQYPEGTPEEALKFFTERYDALAFEVEPARAAGALRRCCRPEEADRVGQDRARAGRRRQRRRRPRLAWSRRLDALGPVIAEPARGPQGREGADARPRPRTRRRSSSPRPRSSPTAPTGATAPTGCASCSTSGRRSPASTGLRRRAVARFSTARTAYTRRRKAHFAEQHEKRDGARVVKERLAKEAEEPRRPRPSGARPPAATAT